MKERIELRISNKEYRITKFLRVRLLLAICLLFVTGIADASSEGIKWHEWGEKPFQVAEKEDKLILLDITAVWCHWCHVMDRETYENPQVAKLINDLFVPIRVDADRRPDVNDHYLSGGWPTTAFLTPTGDKIYARTYVPPDDMKKLLLQINDFYKTHRDSIYNEIAQFRKKQEEERKAEVEKRESEKTPLSREVVKTVLSSLEENFDEKYGGFGFRTKFPNPRALELALFQYHKKGDEKFLEIATKTLDGMREGLYDKEVGGFFRYSTSRNWQNPHYEKMLDINAEILQNYLEAFQATGERRFEKTALGILQYVEKTLFDNQGGGFYGSQDADIEDLPGEKYYRLDKKERKKHGSPSVDKTIFTDWNSKMVRSFLIASVALGEKRYKEAGLKTLDRLWKESFRNGKGMYHVLTEDGPKVEGVLKDQVYMFQALLDGYEVSGDPGYLLKGEKLAEIIIEEYEDRDSGGFFDVARNTGALGELLRRDKNLEVNSVAAQNFTRLYYLTGNDVYREKAERSLTGFSTVASTQEVMGAGFALALERFLSYPVKIILVGPKGERETLKLHQEILRLYEPRKMVKFLDPNKDELRDGELTFPELDNPAVYVCIENLCSAPIETASEFRNTVKEFVRENL
jgi:uncharacterized protein YyaL (SSP411 family)